MRFVVSIVLIIFLSFVACLYFPWWSIAVVAFIVSIVIHQTPGMSFVTGLFALFLLWGSMSLWIGSKNDFAFAHKASMIMFKKDSPGLLVFASAMIGALVAGFAAMAGSYLLKFYYLSRRVH